MSLTTYCELAEVRSALGVNHIELTDEVLGLPVYEMGLVRELNKISTSLNAAFSALKIVDPTTLTAQEKSLLASVHLFSVYAAAKQVGVSLTTFAPKSVTDGKAGVSRLSTDPFETTLRKIDEMYAALRSELAAVYADLLGEAAAAVGMPTVFLASKRSYDPVTG